MAGTAAVTLALASIPRWADWLIRVRPISDCDLMVVLGGGAAERLATAVELMNGGACDKITFTGAGPAEKYAHVRAFLEGLDSSRRVHPVGLSDSTFDDARVALATARKTRSRSILVITSPYHTKRADWIFSRALRGSNVRFGVYPSTALYFRYDRWWTKSLGRRIVINEYLKLWALGLAAEALAFHAGTTAAIR